MGDQIFKNEARLSFVCPQTAAENAPRFLIPESTLDWENSMARRKRKTTAKERSLLHLPPPLLTLANTLTWG